MKTTRRCWFAFEGENKGDQFENETDERAAKLYYSKWQDEAEEGSKIFVRSEAGVTEWSVFPVTTFDAIQLNVNEGSSEYRSIYR